MKKLILALLLIPTFAHADIAILLRNGAIIHWSETGVYYSKEEESLCKGENDRFCINQGSILGIAIDDKEKLPALAMGDPDVDPLILPLSEANMARMERLTQAIPTVMEGRSILPVAAGKRWWEKRGGSLSDIYLKAVGAMAKGWSQGWNQYEDYKMRRDIADIKNKLSSRSSSLSDESFLNRRTLSSESVFDKKVDSESIFGKEVEIRPKYDYDPSNRLRGNIDSSGYGTLRDSNLNRYEVRPRW